MKAKTVLTILLPLFFPLGAAAQDKELENFLAPPDEAKVQVWWHWMDGEVSKEGIYKDLDWMKRMGIGGFHQFDAGGINMPRAAEVKLPYLSDGWKEAYRYALRLADSLGFEVTIASAPGWSSTGGPWVKPEDAIKKLEWKTVDIQGGRVRTKLPELYRTVGPYQDYYSGSDRLDIKPYGKDLYVIAVRRPDGDKSMDEMKARLDITDSLITCSFRRPQTIRAITLKSMAMGGRPAEGEAECRNVLESSMDGETWSLVSKLSLARLPYMTEDIPETRARHFRVRGQQLEGMELHTVHKVNHSEEKAGFSPCRDFWKFATPPASEAISMADVIDLTDKVKEDGTLECALDKGRWRIYRFGWSITGKTNHPASPDATGLEVDKLDPKAWMDYFREYCDLYKEASGGMFGSEGIRYLLTDSYEAGAFTWTPNLPEEFEKRRGYDLVSWLPALTGEIIGSSEETEAFLWDWRATLGELFCENYGRINEIVKEYGLKGWYAESHEGGRAYIGDGMDPKIASSIPMAAIWMENTPTGSGVPSAIVDIRESASVSHIYRQNLVACETFSVNGDEGRAYTYCPENMKYIADIAIGAGVNRFVIHESASQPSDSYLPGLQLFRYGQWFHRNETWGEYAWTLTDYLSRSAALMQSGQPVSDILLYYGEDNNVTGLYGSVGVRKPADPATLSGLPEVPQGYDYDFANRTVLLSGLRAEDGRLIAPSGTEYKVLWLDRNCEIMSLDVLAKIKEYADAGVIICGKAPEKPAGLRADKDAFKALTDDIWRSGRPNVHSGSLEECLKASGIEPDFVSEAGFQYKHRTTGDGKHIYWTRNFSGKDAEAKLSFRDGGKFAAVLNAEDGSVYGVPVTMCGGRYSVSLPYKSEDALFIMFSDSEIASEAAPLDRMAGRFKVISSLDRPWEARFEQKNGGTADHSFGSLCSWTEIGDPVIKYFSGTAVYKTTFNVDAEVLSAQGEISIDLGSVKNIAEIFVNGEPAGTLWKAPFTTKDIRHLLHEGENSLEIKVTNLWRNRMIGDVRPDRDREVTSIRRFYKASAELIPSGLLGPVRLVSFNL